MILINNVPVTDINPKWLAFFSKVRQSLLEFSLFRIIAFQCLTEPSPESFSIGRLCGFAGGLCVFAGGLDIIKLTKTLLIYSVSRFNLGGAWSFAWGG